jgi:PAS domain S-box-containing protein
VPLGLKGRVDRLWRFLAIAIVLVIVVLFYADWRAFQDDSRQTEAARLLQKQTDVLFSSLSEAETGERGYLLTGEHDYLVPWKKALGEIPRELGDLSRTISAPPHTQNAAHNKAEQQQLALMRSMVQDKMAELQRAIDLRDEQGEEAALALMRKNQSKLTMDEVRATGNLLLSGEYLSLYNLQTASGHDADRSRIIVVVGSICLVFLLFRMGLAIDSVVLEREDLARSIDDSRQLLETTLASIGDAVVVTDANGLVRFMNPVAEKMTGCRLADVRHRPLHEIFKRIDELTRKRLEDPFRALQQKHTRKDRNQHALLLSLDNQEIPIEETSAPILDGTGTVLGVVLVFRDIGDRREAERDLERWKQIFAGAGFGMFVADAQTGEIVDVNPTFAEMHGYSVNQLLGNSVHSLVPNDSIGKLSNALLIASKKGRNMFEIQHLRSDGTEFPSLIDVTRFHYGSAELLAGYCSDITDRKRFEDAIKESEERFRTLASALPQLIWSTDSNGHIEYVNQVWVTYAGWSSGDDAGQYLHQYPWSDLLHPEDSGQYFARWSESLQTGETFEVQVRLRRASDRMFRWFLCRAVPVRDRSGRIVRWLGGCTDIQQQMEDATQLKKTNQALQRSNSDLEQFAYAASHDLQEPLRMVSIYSQLLKEEYGNRLDKQALSYIDFAVNGARRMSHMLTALLTYSRVANATPQELMQTDSGAAVTAALLNLSSIVSDTRASIEIGVLPTVRVSEIHLVQLFQNLIGNALKYRKDDPDGQQCTDERPSIRIAAQPDGDKWLFSVSDNGIGIEPEYISQIFGIFKRLHGSAIDGTGIGLALCQKIVERAGGRIWAESEPGKGSTFFFTLQGIETGEYARAYHNSAGRG